MSSPAPRGAQPLHPTFHRLSLGVRRVTPDTPVLRRIPGWPRRAPGPARDPTTAPVRLRVIENYLRFLGPATPHDVAGFRVFVIVGPNGGLRGFHNVCRHRAGPIAREAVLLDVLSAVPAPARDGGLRGRRR